MTRFVKVPGMAGSGPVGTKAFFLISQNFQNNFLSSFNLISLKIWVFGGNTGSVIIYGAI